MPVNLGLEDEPPTEEPPPQEAAQPHSNGHLDHDAEIYLASAVMGDPDNALLGRARHLPPEAFEKPEARAIWGCLTMGLRWPDDLNKFKKRTNLSVPRLFEIQNMAGLRLGFDGWLEQVEDSYRDRQFKHLVGEMSRTDNPDPALWADRLRELLPGQKGADAQAFGAYGIPPEGDTSILLGDRYLNRGDGMVFSGSSGMGKSSQVRQMMTCWAVGRDFHGMKCNGPLKSLEIQAEDSEGDIGESATSLFHCMKLTPEEKKLVNERVLIVTERVRRGSRFIEELRQLVAKHKPDLVWINPLQAFMDGDITESRDLGDFLRAGLNSLNEPPTFGYVIVHHTVKPPKEKTDIPWAERMYQMAGGAELINWARAIISLVPGNEPGEFNLILAKRGTRAGVTKRTGTAGQFEEVETTIALRWSKEEIEIPGRTKKLKALFWESRAPDAPKPSNATGFGRPKKHDFATFRPAIPSDPTKAMTTNVLMRAFQEHGDIGKSAFFNLLTDAVESGFVVKTMVNGHPKYHLKT
jgi:hypothetical protein